MDKYSLMTNKQLADAFKIKTAKASRVVKEIAYKNLDRLTKKELLRYVRHGKVTRTGDISFT